MMNPENSLKMDEIDLQAVTIKKIDIYIRNAKRLMYKEVIFLN